MTDLMDVQAFPSCNCDRMRVLNFLARTSLLTIISYRSLSIIFYRSPASRSLATRIYGSITK